MCDLSGFDDNLPSLFTDADMSGRAILEKHSNEPIALWKFPDFGFDPLKTALCIVISHSIALHCDFSLDHSAL